MKLKLYIPLATTNIIETETECITDSFKYKEVFYNDLRAADTSCNLTIPFSDTAITTDGKHLSDLLKENVNRNIKAQIKYDDNTNYLTGYIRKNYSFSKIKRPQPIKLEIVSPSYLLKVKLTKELLAKSTNTDIKTKGFILENKSVSQIITAILELVGFTYGSTYVIPDIVPIMMIEEGTDLHEVISQLVLEYGYCFSFNNDGNFIIYNVFVEPPSNIVNVGHVFNGYNIVDKLEQLVQENKNGTKIKTTYSDISKLTDTLLYENIEGRDAAHPDGCQLRINPNAYLFNNEWNILEYDSSLGEVVWVESITTNTTGNKDIWDNEGILQITRPIENKGKSCKIKVFNPDQSAAYFLDRLRIRGTAYIKVPNQVYMSGIGDVKEFECIYNHSIPKIQEITNKLSNYYTHANFKIKLKSYENVSVGTIVAITEYYMGTTTGIITSKVSYLSKINPYEYEIESISPYNHIENTELLHKPSEKMASLLAIPPDVTPPTVPNLKRITANSDGSITIIFDKSIDTESGLQYYNIYRTESLTQHGIKEDAPVLFTITNILANEITFTDHTTQNGRWYYYQVSAVDKANNESAKSAERTTQSKVMNPPKSPYAIKCEALADGIDLLIFILRNKTTMFSNSIDNSVFFRIQISLDGGVSWTTLVRIQGNSYLWKWPDTFTINPTSLSLLKFRAFSSNMFNVENPTPIPMMHNRIKYDLATLPPPFKPADDLFTEKVRDTTGNFTIKDGWYRLILKAAGGGGGGGGEGGQASGFPYGAIFGLPIPGKSGKSGASGKDGEKGGDSSFVDSELGLKYSAYGGLGGKGGDGGSGGSGSLWIDYGSWGDAGQDGKPGGTLAVKFWNNINSICFLQKGLGGKGGRGG